MTRNNPARAQILDEISRLLARLRELDGDAQDGSNAPLIGSGWQSVSGLAHGLYRIRRYRDQAFGEGMFADPGWDMLLDLFAGGGGGVSVKSLCAAAIRPPTSGLRALERLIDADLVRRVSDHQDRRQTLILPTAKAKAGMRAIHTRATGSD